MAFSQTLTFSKNRTLPKNPDFWLSQKQDFSKKSGLLPKILTHASPEFKQTTVYTVLLRHIFFGRHHRKFFIQRKNWKLFLIWKYRVPKMQTLLRENVKFLNFEKFYGHMIRCLNCDTVYIKNIQRYC